MSTTPARAPPLLGGRLPSIELAGESVRAVRAEVRESRAELLSLVDVHGGILVTAPALRSPQDFEDCLRELVDICKEYPGGAPRKKVTEGGVFTTTEFDPNLPIAAHTELSYMPRSKPELIAFFCEKAPSLGGMTPVLDMREVLRCLPGDVVARFAPGVRTCLNLPPKLSVYLDSRRGKPRRWQRCWSSYGDTPEAAAQAFARDSPEAVGVEWQDGWMQPFVEMPAIEDHMGSRVWTGFWPSYHWAGSAVQTLFDLALHHRTGCQIRVSLLVVALTVLEVAANVLSLIPGLRPLLAAAAHPGAMSCKLKDGRDVPLWDVFRILRVYNALLVKWPWRPGQFVLIDNHRMGHMRTPYDPQARRIYTAFGSRRANKTDLGGS